ncbi:hypothetical protein DY000_02050119 [Brassica cretica]|uniref:FBD domain-containing protein n=1 Tax=Brassica cretica TaxID=69181 RepID=A0ABQ7EYB7_BRACR|nr:hypothetical protein DY000_02050119 [Brassica cretica]
MKSFHLITPYTENIPYINLWIKCAMSHNVENLSLQIWNQYYEYKLPDFFYNSSSFKQLNISAHTIVPLECNVLDLSKSLSLRTLEVNSVKVAGPTQIVAAHIHCLRLFNSQLSYPLPDVASLTEAELEICFVSMDSQFEADFLQVWILSIAEIRGVPFPVLKVKSLTLDTKIFQYVIPGIERLLQNSPYLEKLRLGAWASNTMSAEFLDIYMKFEGFNLKECWISKDGVSWNKHCVDLKSMHVASFVELLLNKRDKLDKMAELLDELHLKFKGKDVVPPLSHNNNVTIVFLLLHCLIF